MIGAFAVWLAIVVPANAADAYVKKEDAVKQAQIDCVQFNDDKACDLWQDWLAEQDMQKRVDEIHALQVFNR